MATHQDEHALPFSNVILEFYEDDIDPISENKWLTSPQKRATIRNDDARPFSLNCKECGNRGQFCALDNNRTTVFYDSKACQII